MSSEIVVCNDVGPYLEALTRGKEYENTTSNKKNMLVKFRFAYI